MMDKASREEVKRRRSSLVMHRGSLSPSSIPYLYELLESAKDPDDRDDILFHIANEYAIAGRVADQASVLRARVDEGPREISAWLSLADCLSNIDGKRVESRSALSRAIELAKETNTHLRTALGVQARIARRWADEDLFRGALERLIEDIGVARDVDIGFQADLVQGLPATFATGELVERYLRAGGRAR
jgi:hypothetical protein